MLYGHNFDFDSYLIVGDIVSQGGNVYEETSRYNYGPIFSWLQGFLYTISKILAVNSGHGIYRLLMVTVLLVTDLSIAYWCYKKYSWKIAIVFFLNPISIIITGFHNQFDNIAILFMLIASCYYNERKSFGWDDFLFVVFFAISLSTKHIFFFFPFWILLSSNLPIKKRLLYSSLPCLIFFLCFIPYIQYGYEGIRDNVFLYKSFNNVPLIGRLFFMFNTEKLFYLFILLLGCFGFLFRKACINDKILNYTLVLIAFSSAVANQYLVIPILAFLVYSINLKYIYLLCGFVFLLINIDGFALLGDFNGFFLKILNKLNSLEYFIACFLSFLLLMKNVHLFNSRIEKYL